jgi:hypothetical protein
MGRAAQADPAYIAILGLLFLSFHETMIHIFTTLFCLGFSYSFTSFGKEKSERAGNYITYILFARLFSFVFFLLLSSVGPCFPQRREERGRGGFLVV